MNNKEIDKDNIISDVSNESCCENNHQINNNNSSKNEV